MRLKAFGSVLALAVVASTANIPNVNRDNTTLSTIPEEADSETIQTFNLAISGAVKGQRVPYNVLANAPKDIYLNRYGTAKDFWNPNGVWIRRYPSVYSTPLQEGWRSRPWKELTAIDDLQREMWKQINDAHYRTVTPRVPTNIQLTLPLLPLKNANDTALLSNLDFNDWGDEKQAIVALFHMAVAYARKEDNKAWDKQAKELQQRVKTMREYNVWVVCYHSWELCCTSYPGEMCNKKKISRDFANLDWKVAHATERREADLVQAAYHEGLYRLGKDLLEVMATTTELLPELPTGKKSEDAWALDRNRWQDHSW